MNERQHITSDMTIMLPSSARRMSPIRYMQVTRNPKLEEDKESYRHIAFLSIPLIFSHPPPYGGSKHFDIALLVK